MKDGETEFKREKAFQKNKDLERQLKEINGILGPVEDEILESYSMPQYPVVFITGCGRSGSTVMHQWLATTGNFSYPSNLLSRFYGAPFIGAKIQQLLTDPRYDFNHELFNIKGESSFKSYIGKTKGALEPHEFWYFWRRFFPNTDIEYVDEQSLRKIDCGKFTAELAAIEAVFDKPLAMKAHILMFNIPFLSSILNKVLFIFVTRHPFYIIQSLIEARVRFLGDRSAWYGSRPKEIEDLKSLKPIEQVVGQVYFTNRAIEEGLSKIDATRGLQVGYEQFCSEPEMVFSQIKKKFGQQGYKVAWDYVGPTIFQSANKIRLPREDCERIIDSYKEFSGVELSW